MNNVKTSNNCPRKLQAISLLVSLLAFATALYGQNAVPTGTILPVQLNSSLNSKKSKPGQVITARVMQDVPLPSGGKIRAGSKAVGHIIDVAEASNGSGAKLSLQFDRLAVSNRALPITTDLRALASMMDVEDAQVPQIGPDRGTSEDAWTTTQIGGDVDYHDGPVTKGLQVVGMPTHDGVLVRLASKPGTKCRGDLSGSDLPQAFWLFSADACGTYGFRDLTIQHAGRSNPVGQITLTSEKDNFDVRSGSGLLLRVE